MQEGTNAAARKTLRDAAYEVVKEALSHYDSLRVFKGRVDVPDVQDCVSVSLSDLERDLRHNGADSEVYLSVRIITREAANRADDHLDGISSYIENHLELSHERLGIFYCSLVGVEYSDPSENSSQLELKFHMKFEG